MVFTKRLREPLMRGGFKGVVDLLKVAKHRPGERVHLVEFEWRG